MSHTAFNEIAVVPRLPLKIECLAIYGSSQLLVGTEKGNLLVYSIENTRGGAAQTSFKVTLSENVNQFARRAIKQMEVVHDMGMLFSLSDGYVNIHSLSNLQPMKQFQKGKGCEVFSIEQTAPRSLTLCLGLRKRLLVYRAEGKSIQEFKDISLHDTPKAMVCCGSNVFIGFKKDYVLVDLQAETVKELFPTGRSGTPSCTVIPGEQVLLGRDGSWQACNRAVSIFLGYDGKPTRKYGLTWSETPSSVSFAYPYALGVTSRGVEVRSVFAPKDVQTAAQILQLKGCKTVAVGVDKYSDIVYAASPQHIWRLEPRPFDVQIEELKANHEFEIALSLCEQLSTFQSDADRMRELNDIRELSAHHLFKKGRYEEAMQLFMMLDCNPLTIIGLYPNLLPREPGVVRLVRMLMVKRRRFKEQDLAVSIHGGNPPERLGDAKTALLALIQYLSHARQMIQSEEAAAGEKVVHDTESPYAQCRDLAVIVDTTLLKAYLKDNDSLVASLLRVPNHCHTGECEKVLKGYEKWEELVLLYRSKGDHVKALNELTRQAQGPSRNPMSGTGHLITYLQSLNAEHLDLILKYSRFPLNETPDDALEIFTTERSEHPLPSGEVLSLLKLVARDLVERYLEWLIEGPRRETLEDFHNELALQYLDTISRAGGSMQSTRRKLLQFLKRDPYHYTPAKLLNKLLDEFPGQLQEERATLFCRLGRHEKALSVYAHELNNFELAEEYCARTYNEENEAARDVYLHLLRVLVRPVDGPPNWNAAKDLLQRHFQRINAGKALELMPDDTSIAELYSFFENVLRDSMETRRNDQVIRNLLKAENLQVREKKLAATSARVIKIEEDTMCPVCNKRMGISAFACYPNGNVVHYKCRGESNRICPVTGTKFGSG